MAPITSTGLGFSRLLISAAILASTTLADTYTYPVKSINLDSAASPVYYSAFRPDQMSIGRTVDPHAVHGTEIAPSTVLLSGKGQQSESSSTTDAFAVALSSSTGAKSWSWTSAHDGNDAANAATVLPASGEVLVAGWREVSGVGCRSVTKLSATGTEAYTAVAFGDSSGAHGAFEMVKAFGDDVFLSGLKDKNDLEEMSFKSYGNVPSGTAVVTRFASSAFGSSAPAAGDAVWTKDFSGYASAKTVEEVGTDKLAVLLYAEESEKHAAIVVLNRADGSTVWGPTDYGNVHGEGTDLAVVGNDIFIIGHGGSGGELSGRATKVASADGQVSWTKSFSVGGNTQLIYNECWGVSANSDGSGLIASCGAGIETCDGTTGQTRTDCLAGNGDPRTGAYNRGAGNWYSYVVKIGTSDGTVAWQRVDSYKAPGGPAMSSSSFDPSSSAAEWVFGMSSGNIAIVTDEVFGVGLLVLDPSNSGGGGGATSTSAPTPAPDNVDGDNGASSTLTATALGFLSFVIAAVSAIFIV
mmetsp:Transcript_3708/g.7029  ORF Transcript_3708/g.7029 Transcript_3708/m.7029 type:complete len:525 (-) Transcript_3708:75-1649(-)|eukprot:CAMPEP_0182455044 /NCGR_PEP_ID=MMETSP1319-20130603/1388_1 /TAXON_ID=172717 /ORGANISM="Bolidomonas pacifica, Strain RCC208" /LENGTH=524 /DNA_ID=CAMNT_0024653073 /DNA_START=119 /DNA_END=1693 /DNA_ORIENTATION=-